MSFKRIILYLILGQTLLFQSEYIFVRIELSTQSTEMVKKIENRLPEAARTRIAQPRAHIFCHACAPLLFLTHEIYRRTLISSPPEKCIGVADALAGRTLMVMDGHGGIC